jgi:hypothetical protein
MVGVEEEFWSVDRVSNSCSTSVGCLKISCLKVVSGRDQISDDDD